LRILQPVLESHNLLSFRSVRWVVEERALRRERTTEHRVSPNSIIVVSKTRTAGDWLSYLFVE